MIDFKKAIHLVLLLGIAFRVYCALHRTDLIWPDEHYQVLEPAGKAVWGFGFMSWEWAANYRSWAVPGLFMPLFFILKALGISGGPIAIYSARVLVAFFSGLSLITFNRWLKALELSDFSRWVGVSAFALHSSLILWGVSSLSDHLSLILFTFFLPVVFKNPTSFFSGILLGSTFLIRIQSITWMPGYAVFLLIQRSHWKEWLRLSFGYFVCILLSGALDWITLKHPFISTVVQLTRGIAISQQWGSMRWSQYFSNLLTDLGPVMCLASIASIYFSFQLKAYRRLWYFVSLPSFSLFFVHMALPHKETRFILPTYFAVIFWLTLGAENAWIHLHEDRRRCFHRFNLGITILLGALSFWRVSAARNFTTGRDDFDLEARIRKEGILFQPHIEKCIITSERQWSWDRAQLMQGTEFDYVEMTGAPSDTNPSQHCPVAIVKNASTSAWIAQGWTLIQSSDRSDYALLRRPGFSKRLPKLVK